ncbi:MAG: dihydroorotate dehydrogenase [Chloroflexi bacterium]|nr:dihydroorotate dehydrogenase [Chloroflexota bacterium]
MPHQIELAPSWKRSLTISNPIIFAAGGYTTEATNIGALVTLPTTLHTRVGAPMPRVIEIPGGVLMRTGAANPGWTRVLREHRRAWEQSQMPIIVAFAAQGAREWVTLAAQIENVAGIGGIELHFNPALDAAEAIRAVRAATELPILAKLDLDNAREIAADCAAAGANALVIGRAPRGMKIVDGKTWYGRLYAPSVLPLALRAVAEIAGMKLDAPLVACGGVHSAEDARAFLAAGACAVEIDSAEWIEPGIAARIAAELESQTNEPR